MNTVSFLTTFLKNVFETINDTEQFTKRKVKTNQITMVVVFIKTVI